MNEVELNKAEMITEPSPDHFSVNRKIKRNIKSFYLHDSKKGYTHGCIEVESLLFDFLINYREDKSSIKLKVQYPSLNHITNGGTRRL